MKIVQEKVFFLIEKRKCLFILLSKVCKNIKIHLIAKDVILKGSYAYASKKKGYFYLFSNWSNRNVNKLLVIMYFMKVGIL